MGEYATHGDLVEKFHRLLPDATIADFQKVRVKEEGRLSYIILGLWNPT